MGASRLRFVAAALALGFVLAIVAGSAGLFGGSRAFAAGTTLTVIGGDVFVRHGASDFVAASDGETLNAGDAIRTGADGRAVLTYFEGSTVTVKPGTELGIDTAATTPDGGTVVLMTQTAGRTWHVVTKLITGSSKYEVRTPASTASVRGTEFQVDASNDETTVTTTEGTVVQHVPDPAQPTRTVDVPVSAGTTQTQQRNAPAAPSRTAPEPKRKVTVTVGAGNTNILVVDPLGRSNGVTRDGKLVVQTPGAEVRRDGDRIIVTLPDLPDGKLTTRIDKKDDSDNTAVAVNARVEEQGKSLDLVDKTASEGSKKVAGFEIRKRDDGNTGTRPLDDSEKQDLPSAKVVEARRASASDAPTPSETRRATHTPEAIAEPTTRTNDRTATPTPTERRSFELRTLAPSNTPRTESPNGSDSSRATDSSISSGAALVTRFSITLPVVRAASSPVVTDTAVRVDGQVASSPPAAAPPTVPVPAPLTAAPPIAPGPASAAVPASPPTAPASPAGPAAPSAPSAAPVVAPPATVQAATTNAHGPAPTSRVAPRSGQTRRD